MEPIPEVRAAAIRLAALGDQTLDLVDSLKAVCALAEALLPSSVGVSITVVVDGDPFTVTATAEQINAVDAAQYIDGGPCLDAAAKADEVLVEDVLDENRWHCYAQAATATGIRASMSLPLKDDDGRPIGALNLYASDAAVFRDNGRQLAELFGLHVNELVANADLSFMTRELARELPQRLAEHEQVNQAIGVLMGVHGWTAAGARERFDFAAAHAHASRADVASIVMMLDT
jgi:GAF domain-containing protein